MRKKRNIAMSAIIWLALTATLLAANVRWTGGANDVAQVTTSTITGTWATADEAVAEINNKQVVLTLGTDVATTDVAAELAASINAAARTGGEVGTTADETRNIGGQEIGEFVDVIASASGSVLTVKSRVAGTPFTATFSETTAGSGAMGAAATPTAATGNNFFNNADNWEGGVLPSATDTLVFDSGTNSVIYGLANATLDYVLERNDGYGGSIGLAKINATHSGKSYDEYRQRFLDLPITATTGSVAHSIGGRSSAPPQGLTYIDLGTNDPAAISVFVYDTAVSATDGAPVQLVGGVDIVLTIYKGNVDVGTNLGETTTSIATATTFDNGTPTTDVNLRIGTNASFLNGTAPILQYNGTINLEADCAGSNNKIEVHGGTLNVAQSSTLNDLSVYGGTVDFRGDGIATLAEYGGIFDASRCASATLGMPILLYNGFTHLDPANVLGQSIEFQGCSISDGTLVLRKNLSFTIGAAGTATPD